MRTQEQQRESARKRAEAVEQALRTVLRNERQALEEFEQYVDSWTKALKAVDDGEIDPRAYCEDYVVDRGVEVLEGVLHMPTGGSRHMHYRSARGAMLRLPHALAELAPAPEDEQ